MTGKIQLKCTIEVVTGMHIGANNAFSAIGALDSPVVIDPLSREPILPGSSLKGKLRTLLVKALCADNKCSVPAEPLEDPAEIKKLFGCAGGKNKISHVHGCLQFSDGFVSNVERFKISGHPMIEVKSENNINRGTGVATPRQIERVVRGTRFLCSIVYEIFQEADIQKDLALLARGMEELQMDYLGGHGTRGSGRVSLKNVEVVGYTNPSLSQEEKGAIHKLFEDALACEILPLQTDTAQENAV